MANEISKTQLDRLGDRLRKGDLSEADLRLLDQYRRSFSDAYEIVVGRIRKELALEPTGRPEKSTPSICEKLRREHIRLTQIQDIAGCRLIVPAIVDQDNVVRALANLFERTTIVDRRQQPSHGYRAVHVVVNLDGKMIEIQARTALQQMWAELSEKLSDVVDPAIKYGGGNEHVQAIFLTNASFAVAGIESLEMRTVEREEQLRLISQGNCNNEIAQQFLDAKRQVADSLEEMKALRQGIIELLREATELVETSKGKKHEIPD